MVVTDVDGDGIPDTFDTLERIALMEGARVLEALMARRRALFERTAHQNERLRDQAQARLRAEAVQSRYRLEPVLQDSWWARADLETIGDRYAEAKSWEGVDPSFQPFVDRIEERAKALHNVEPDHLMDAVRARDRVPMTLDEARAVAMQEAPQWYRIQDRITSGDLRGQDIDKNATRLVEDMTKLRDTGVLDTDSAKMEWSLFMDHGPALRGELGERETMDEWRAARAQAAGEFWDNTVQERAALNIPPHADGIMTARPMSVAEARAFSNEFAPEWFKFGHAQNLAAANEGDNMAHDHQQMSRLDDQMRYAMEQYRDTGTMGHQYAAGMRAALAGHPEVDVAEPLRDIPTVDRVRFGASPHARPMTDNEALELMQNYAPEWYVKPTLAALSPDSALSPEQRAGQVDAIRADMTRLRDRGVLDTDNAKMVWAVQNPDVESEGYDWGLPARPTDVWAQTAERRPGPAVVPTDVRERMGGMQTPPDPAEPVVGRTAPVPEGDKPMAETPWFDSVSRRRHEAQKMRDLGASPQAVKAYMVADVGVGKDPAHVDAVRQPKKAKNHGHDQARKKRQKM